MMNLIHGDCLEKMKELPDNSVDSIVTDPPYGLSFMGKEWDYDVPKVEIWKECFRVLKPGGHLLAFAGTRTQHRMAVNIEDAGFEIRDMIAWVYASGFPKSLNIGKAVDKLQGNEREFLGIDRTKVRKDNDNNNTYAKHTGQRGEITKGNSPYEGWGTALKPALEPITVARKPISEKNIAENVLKWGTGGINIDECRVETNGEEVDIHHTKGASMFKEGEYENINRFNSTLGRFPANFIHDGSEEVVGLFPNSKGASSQNNFSNGSIYRGQSLQQSETKLEGFREWYNDSGSASRFFYCAKASKSERNAGLEGMEERENSGSYQFRTDGSLDGKPTQPKANFHPTVKPIKLMEYLVTLVTPKDGIVLDPFLGSGTTGVACKNLNRNFIGIELEESYYNIAKNRINQ